MPEPVCPSSKITLPKYLTEHEECVSENYIFHGMHVWSVVRSVEQTVVEIYLDVSFNRYITVKLNAIRNFNELACSVFRVRKI